MKVISHRGYWTQNIQKNSVEAFVNSFSKGFGTETDVRDSNGILVISHDIPAGNELSFEDFIKLYKSFDIKSPIAINIKSDGLASSLRKILSENSVTDYVCFDMSVPDTRDYIKNGLKYLSRVSEEEAEPSFTKESSGVWLDSFYGNWFDACYVVKLLEKFECVYIVSAELHGRDYIEQWNLLKSIKQHNIVLCTDYPEVASEFFEIN